MRDLMRMAVAATAAAVLAGCGSTSSQEALGPRVPSVTSVPATPDSPTLATARTTTPPPQQPQPTRPRLLLTHQGLGAVPVGAPLKKFAEALSRDAVSMTASDRSVFHEHSCAIRELARLKGVGLMVIGEDPEGQVRRISVAAGSYVRTDTGIGVGSSMEEVRAAYGPGLNEPFDHFPAGGDAVLVRAGANRYLAFIGDDRERVVELRLGYKPEVLNPEGCV